MSDDKKMPKRFIGESYSPITKNSEKSYQPKYSENPKPGASYVPVTGSGPKENAKPPGKE